MLKYLLPLILIIPATVYVPVKADQLCVRTKSVTYQGYYDEYGIWWGPQTVQQDVFESCYISGYVPPVGRPAPYVGNIQHFRSRYIPLCGKSTLTILGIPIIGSTNICQ
jgi:hypothetical protein